MTNHARIKLAIVLALCAFASSDILAQDDVQETARGKFLAHWKVLGPVPAFIEGKPRTPDFARRRSFEADLLRSAGGVENVEPQTGDEVTVRETSLKWFDVTADTAAIDLQKTVGEHEWSIAYASTIIHSSVDQQAVLGLGSDDAIRVWVNGELVHDNWIGRSLTVDSDLLPMRLRKGKNRLMLKVLNRKLGWGFSARMLTDKQVANKFVTAGLQGNVDRLKRLHASGVDLESTNELAMTAYQGAKFRGHHNAAKWLAQAGANTRLPDVDPAEFVDAILTEESDSGQPGVAVLVSRGGKILLSKGYGLANITEKTPITSKTKFRIGSVTKQFAAAAILKLQEDGKLSVSDTLTKFIPDYPRGDEVTLHHLLTHTSGITSYTSKPGFFEGVTKPIDPEAMIASFKNDDFDFAPGEKWSYSNSGYFLLGHIVEKASGQSFADYLRETFLVPLGMTDTGIHRADLGLENEAHGYSFSGETFVDALNWDMSQAGAAGAIYSTVEDLHRWNEGVFGGRVLRDATLAAAFTKAETRANDNAMGYGYGWAMGQQRGLAMIHHSGGLQGFSSYLTRFPKQELTIAVLHNALPGTGELEPGRLAAIIAESFLWKEMSPHPSREVDDSVDPSVYAALTGDYDYGQATLTVTTEDDRLFAQLTGQPKMEIFPASRWVFFWKVVNAEVEFLRDVDDRVVAVQHTQNGQTFEAKKLKKETAVQVTDAVLDSYVGIYDFGAVGKFVVTRRGDHLAAKLASQPAIDVYAKSKTKFFYKVIRAELEFVVVEGGKVSKVILRQGGAELEGNRID